VSTGHTNSGGTPGVYPDGGRTIWLLGMLIKFKALGEDTGGEYSLYEQTVPPGAGAPPHIHHSETEAFYILQGEFEFLNNDHTVRANTGDFIFVPKGNLHGFRNIGEGIAKFLAITTPGGLHEKLLGEIGEPAKAEALPPPPQGAPDIEQMTQIARKYDTEIPSPEQ
jgi:quercetin dioxygenase-like cupin family protein